MTHDEAMLRIASEAASADAKYGGFTSSHEGFGVLAEEVSELLDAIHRNSRSGIRSEAIQVAAVALRLACSDGDDYRTRSGLG